MSKKQTAVEWLMSELWIHLNLSLGDRERIYLQAKELEKQNLIDAVNNTDKKNLEFVKRILGNDIRKYQVFHDNKEGEEYYNNTFNQ